jgi:hypothetical protein
MLLDGATLITELELGVEEHQESFINITYVDIAEEAAVV